MATSKANLTQPAFNSPNWDVPLNSNFGILLDALGQITSTSVTTTNVILNASQAQKVGLSVTGTMTAARTLFLPQNVSGMWFVSVGVAGGFQLTIASDNGSGVAAGATFLPVTGYSYLIWSDGVNVYNSVSNTVQKSGDTMVGSLALPSNGLNVGSGQLQVTGGNVTTTGQFTASNNVTAFSDARLKTDVEQITGALGKVRGMRGVTFRRIDDETRHAGVIAQEVQPHLPEVVYENEDGMLHVAYGNIVSVLIEAIKELEQRVVYLEARK
jgi:hypothetical protein